MKTVYRVTGNCDWNHTSAPWSSSSDTGLPGFLRNPEKERVISGTGTRDFNHASRVALLRDGGFEWLRRGFYASEAALLLITIGCDFSHLGGA